MLGGYTLCGHRLRGGHRLSSHRLRGGHGLRDHTGGAAVTGWVTCGSGPAAIELVSLCSACRPAESVPVYFQLLVTETAPWPERSSSGAALHAAHRATLEGMPA